MANSGKSRFNLMAFVVALSILCNLLKGILSVIEIHFGHLRFTIDKFEKQGML